MKPNQAKDFDALQKEWRKKLKDSGFKDLEREDETLNSHSYELYGRVKRGQLNPEISQNYYRLAGFFLHEYKFESEFDRQVWDGHSQGKSIRSIVQYLKNNKIPRLSMPTTSSSGKKKTLNRRNVHETIQKLKAEMYEMYKVSYDK